MYTNSPLRIFSKNQVDSLNRENLKRLKKEILLEFQLTNESTIVLNGMEVDKNTILEIFEELHERLPLYKFIYENKTLNTFLNLGNLTLFDDNKTIEKIKNQSEFKNDIEQKIVAKIKPILAKLIMKPSNGNYELRSANRFITNLNPDLVYEAFSEGYKELKIHLDYLDETFKTPFIGVHNTNFHFDIRKHVNFNFYNTIAGLPDIFNPLVRQYCRWCNDNVVYEALSREKSFQKFSREALIIIKNAAIIASDINNREGNLKIARSIQAYLDGTRSQSGSSPGGPSVWTVLIAIFLFVRIIFFIGKCSNSSNSYSHNNNTHIDYKKIMEDSQKRIALKKRSVFRDLSGDNISVNDVKITNHRDLKTLTELEFDVDVLPTNYANFYKLIPEKLAQKHKGKLRPVVMSFKNPKIKGSTLEHRLLYDFKSTSKFYPQEYNFKKPKPDKSLNLSIKRIPYSNYPLNGVLDIIDSNTKDVLQSSSFTITYKKNKGEYYVNLTPSNEKLIIPKEYISTLTISKDLEEKDKFTIAIKNMNLLNKKYLSQGKHFTLNDVFAYSFEHLDSKYHTSMKILSDPATIKYFSTSEEDNISYLELKNDNVHINFFLDFPTGNIKGMTMISSNYDASKVERMTLFSSK